MLLPTPLHPLQSAAYAAFSQRDFRGAVDALDQLLLRQPNSARLYEMRAQALVDGKVFERALTDFDAALQLMPRDELVSRARLLAGRALAREGLSDWRGALSDYEDALKLAEQGVWC